MILREPFICDDLIAGAWLEKISPSHSIYPKSLLLAAYIQKGWRNLEEALFKKLMQLRTEDKEMLSMFYYMASDYFSPSQSEYKNMLEKSVELCAKHVKNLVALGYCLKIEHAHLFVMRWTI